MRNHNFKRLNDTNIDDVACYVIGLETHKGDYSAEGTIIIARHNFAIYQLNYALYDETETAVEDNNVRDRGRRGQLMFAVRTEYRPRKTSMHLYYISFRNNFRLHLPPKISVDSLVADIGRGCFQVYFNNVPKRETALDLANYKVKLAGKRIELVEAEVLGNSVVLFPPADKRYLLKTLIKYNRKELNAEEAYLTIEGVQDEAGNLVDVPQKLDMLQFREFFTQQILEEVRLLPDSIYMFKERPIFKEQSVSRPDNFEEYWMNTPLQDSD